jgi:hypothetical protein
MILVFHDGSETLATVLTKELETTRRSRHAHTDPFFDVIFMHRKLTKSAETDFAVQGRCT